MLGLCAVSIALVLTLWGTRPRRRRPRRVAQAASAATAATVGNPASGAATADKQKPKPKRWKAYKGAFFNNPHVNADRFKIERRIIDTIRHTPKGETIRIAVYSFDREGVADALIAAHKRGVKIQMLLNDHQDTHAMKRVRAVLGTNRFAKSFIYKCKQGCRTFADQYRNLHSKFYTFTQAGKSKDVMVVGSVNLTRNAIYHQWNDVYFMSGNEALFEPVRQHLQGHEEGLQHQAAADPLLRDAEGRDLRRLGRQVHDLDLPEDLDALGRRGARHAGQDPVPDARRQRRPDPHPPRALDAHHARRPGQLPRLRDPREVGPGLRLPGELRADRLQDQADPRRLDRARPDPAAVHRARLPPRRRLRPQHDGEDDVILDYYTHQKYLVIQGTYNGVPNTNMVLTGSSNWASLGTAEDEVFFTIQGRNNAKRYLANFNSFWNSGRWSRNAYTTTYTDFKVARMERQADGSYQKVYVTVRRPVTTVERDPYRAGGQFWEGD